MTWSYRSPDRFPARFPRALREAAASPTFPVMLFQGPRSEVIADAENFRYYRWCLRQKPDHSSELYRILSTHQIRTSTEHRPEGSVLYVTAQSTRWGDLSGLNPHLADLIAETP